MAQHNKLGELGEKMAVEHLQKKGYDILARNFRYMKNEVDIIAQTGNTLVVVEVKTRSTPDFGLPQDFVKPAQIRRLVSAVDHYVVENEMDDVEIRFDIVGIVKREGRFVLEHIEDAFYHF